jgi:hypothetical protein
MFVLKENEREKDELSRHLSSILDNNILTPDILTLKYY